MDADQSVSEVPPGRAYTAPDVTVYYEAARCVHFAECVRGLPQVFDTAARPWIQPGRATAEEVAEVIRRCPSGALHYLLPDGPAETAEPITSVVPLPGGPLLLRGPLSITVPRPGETDGPAVVAETRMAACRCGRTANVPFCDGSCDLHK
ncbi:(4Fe-4S)-binding protein [Nocardia huaxiensis]|uniref:(4Fe-4S)-binding protein n=1 Tax=Nocardia huaxiensis TaxID=2755382 RepID=A0A7D6Z8F0_9NOCA|nr:(4Fe-4S)-binding protein [Nocardia huaxiensis]QLY27558.1 (4Fe-4S)-binding protein [Nocardia huaxiensis]UFS99065.1 (4Fe-4S)-binding protein [Nocardia huaxiensis]